MIDANEHAASTRHRNVSAEVIRAMGAVFHPPRQRFEVTVEMLAQHLDELPADVPEYAGVDLRKELWALGSRVDLKISITGTVGPKLPDADPK